MTILLVAGVTGAASFVTVCVYACIWLRRHSSFRRLHHNYFAGLNYLLNEEPDKAVDIFVELVNANDDTIETHLSLGALFRRRGEVDRAIRIHHNLMQREQLSKVYRSRALLELSRDYARAGVLDRAEKLLTQLVEMKVHLPEALQELLLVYQQEKNWSQAVIVAGKLQHLNNDESMSEAIAQYYCEMAEQAGEQGKNTQATRYLHQADKMDPNCVRSSILQGHLALEHRQYKKAISYFQRVGHQDDNFLVEVLPHMVRCYQRLGDDSGLLAYLKSTFNRHPNLSVLVQLILYFERKHGNRVALDFVIEQVKHHRSIVIVHHLVRLHCQITSGAVKDQLEILYDLTSSLLADRALYCCDCCGFSGKMHYWLCPGCQTWNSFKPHKDIEVTALCTETVDA